MKRMLLRALVCASAVVALSSARTDANATVVATAPNGPCVWCHDDCPIGQHEAGYTGMSLPLEWTRNGGAHVSAPCFSGTCESKHGPSPCDEGGGEEIPEGDSEDLLASIATRDAASFKEIAGAYPGVIIVNADRAAVQIVGCSGWIVAHLPIDNRFLAQVAE